MASKKTGATRLAELAGAPPKLASAADLQAAGPRTGRTHAKQTTSEGKGGDLRINLKAVSAALVDEGFDPAVEITKILKGEMMTDDGGKPVVHPVTGEVMRTYRVDADVRLRMLNEVLQYTQPKLKAVEMKVSGTLDLTSEQLDNRLNMLLAKATKGKK
jgi:hypothetical protein